MESLCCSKFDIKAYCKKIYRIFYCSLNDSNFFKIPVGVLEMTSLVLIFGRMTSFSVIIYSNNAFYSNVYPKKNTIKIKCNYGGFRERENRTEMLSHFAESERENRKDRVQKNKEKEDYKNKRKRKKKKKVVIEVTVVIVVKVVERVIYSESSESSSEEENGKEEMSSEEEKKKKNATEKYQKNPKNQKKKKKPKRNFISMTENRSTDFPK